MDFHLKWKWKCDINNLLAFSFYFSYICGVPEHFFIAHSVSVILPFKFRYFFSLQNLKTFLWSVNMTRGYDTIIRKISSFLSLFRKSSLFLLFNFFVLTVGHCYWNNVDVLLLQLNIKLLQFALMVWNVNFIFKYMQKCMYTLRIEHALHNFEILKFIPSRCWKSCRGRNYKLLLVQLSRKYKDASCGKCFVIIIDLNGFIIKFMEYWISYGYFFKYS